MLSGGKWGVNGVCMRGQRPRASRREERGASWGPEDERENEESRLPNLDNMLVHCAFCSRIGDHV